MVRPEGNLSVPMLLVHTYTQVHWLSQPQPPVSYVYLTTDEIPLTSLHLPRPCTGYSLTHGQRTLPTPTIPRSHTLRYFGLLSV